MSSEPKSSRIPPYPVILGIGVVLTLAGAFLSPALAESPLVTGVAKMGIPLDPGTTISTIGVFLILFPAIQYFFLNPLADAITERNTNLERTFSEAENLRAEMQQLRTEYEQRLAATEAQAREQIQAQIREAQQLRQTLMTEAAEKADALVARAEQEIAAERDRLITDMRSQVVDITLSAAERVIGENMDTERNRRLVADFIDKVEVAG